MSTLTKTLDWYYDTWKAFTS